MPLKISYDAPADGPNIIIKYFNESGLRASNFTPPMGSFSGESESQTGVEPYVLITRLLRELILAPNPIRIYALRQTDVRNQDNPLKSAIPGPWLYFVISYINEPSPQTVNIEGAIELVRDQGDDAWIVGGIASGPHYRNLGEVLLEAERYFSSKGEVEPRLLDVPGLGCRALWFHAEDDSNDIFWWLPSSEKESVPKPLIPSEEFVQQLKSISSSPGERDDSRPRESIPADMVIDRSSVEPFDPFSRQSKNGSIPSSSAEFMKMVQIPPEIRETIQNLEDFSEDDLFAYLGAEIERHTKSALPAEAAEDVKSLLGGGTEEDRRGFLKRLADNFFKELHRKFYSLVCNENDPDNPTIKAGLAIGVEAGAYTLALALASTLGIGWGIAIAAGTIIAKRVVAAGHVAFCETWKAPAID
jgi:hypothetical protein